MSDKKAYPTSPENNLSSTITMNTKDVDTTEKDPELPENLPDQDVEP